MGWMIGAEACAGPQGGRVVQSVQPACFAQVGMGQKVKPLGCTSRPLAVRPPPRLSAVPRAPKNIPMSNAARRPPWSPAPTRRTAGTKTKGRSAGSRTDRPATVRKDRGRAGLQDNPDRRDHGHPFITLKMPRQPSRGFESAYATGSSAMRLSTTRTKGRNSTCAQFQRTPACHGITCSMSRAGSGEFRGAELPVVDENPARVP